MTVLAIGPEQTLLVKAARLWRGSPEPPEKDALVCLHRGRVAAVFTGTAGMQVDQTALWGDDAVRLTDIMRRILTDTKTTGREDGPIPLPGQPDTAHRHPFTCVPAGDGQRQPPPCRTIAPRLFPPGCSCTGTGAVRVLELPGCMLMPGLVDCHVHLALDGRDFNASRERWNDRAGVQELIGANLSAALERGITAVRDGGDLALAGLAARDTVAAGRPPGPLVLASGHALRRRGEYGSFLGPGLTPAELETAVDRLAGRGVDQIKVLVSGLVSFREYRRVGGPQFSAGELERIVNCAHSRGLKVMAHASGDEAVRLAVEAGADSIEHGYFVRRETLVQMAARGIPWVPTVVPVACQLQEGFCAQYSPAEKEVIRQTYRRQLQQIGLARQLGVMLGVGTDAGAGGVPHGRGYLDELLLYREAGLTPPETLLAATVNGAAILGAENVPGTIAPGKPARLIAVRGDPWRDTGALADVRYVIIAR
ncbi:metal-dependent hydrolase family protein [Desulfotomaculum copahuensis]|uniref:Amidohydrolase-related domain-containing protein n=1 Tax=Desulfotomaculum copahuensis TaxID=1838280 RepID=A0A1B7LCP4_9FIRM|nr:amidohydrolase family protein [Desulfotomaculum copahuensis]OAT80692.1 hypothetical protein A6M21_13265 [Desulfotomaculum copahuensis]